MHSIGDCTQQDLQVTIDDFFDAVCKYNPTWIMNKNKFHYLVHTPWMIKRFGPLGLVAEDRFKKFHGLWRQSSIYSNHHTASRDSALHFNSLDATKHVLSGGIFKWEGKMIHAGEDVIAIFASNTHLRERLGLRAHRTREPGMHAFYSKLYKLIPDRASTGTEVRTITPLGKPPRQ